MELPRYLINFDSRELKKEMYDVIIIGSGIAGVYTALCIPDNLSVAIITKEEINVSNSVLAQGGIAVSLGKEDSPKLHFKDTIFAGAGLCNEDAVWVLVNNAKDNIKRLCNYGVMFDKGDQGDISLSLEAAHSKNRIVHIGDATGREVCDTLIAKLQEKKNVKIFEKTTVIDVITKDNVCKGVLALQHGQVVMYLSRAVICAAGGYGRIFSNTTNPEVSTGDGSGMAYRMGAELMDLEFVQFHPTVLYHPENKSFLISEAVRGAGAVLRNIHGERFMQRYHELVELAPRDIVSRAIFNELQETQADHVYLDITFKDRDYLMHRFPNIFSKCLEYGIDISKDFIPVAPAEHYCMGGIRTDPFGRTAIEGFYACGESACTGIHGANRLASNSLLEGLVFGRNIAQQVENILQRPSNIEFDEVYNIPRQKEKVDTQAIKEDIRNIMEKDVGMIRNKTGLLKAKEKISNYLQEFAYIQSYDESYIDLQNMLLVSWLSVNSALEREESRGAHYRSDFPNVDDTKWKKNIIVSKGDINAE